MTAPQDRAGLVRVMAAAFFASRHRSIGNALEDALAAIEAAGCRVVPVEATGDMCAFFHEGHYAPLDRVAYRAAGGFPKAEYEWAFMGYRAMLAASPFAPPQGDTP